MPKPKIIIPLRPKTVAEAQRLILAIDDQADLIEIWLDGIKDLDESKIKKLIALTEIPLMFNLKNKKEGGTSRFGDKKRIELLKLVAEAEADFVDADLDLPIALLRDLKKSCGKTKLILSFHDFEKTPKIERLQKLAAKAFKAGADVVKFATRTKDWDDCTPILQISWELAKAKKQFLTMGMGAHGEPTRVLTPLIGGLGMFAPLRKSDATAPGQLTVAELREWWGAFN